jgi:hypothetical protein
LTVTEFDYIFDNGSIFTGNNTITISGVQSNSIESILITIGDDIVGNSVAISVWRNTTYDSYCFFAIEAYGEWYHLQDFILIHLAEGCGECMHGTCEYGTGQCVCENGYAGRIGIRWQIWLWLGIACNMKLESIGLAYLIVTAICCFVIGLGTMASICRIYNQTNLPKAFSIF